MGAQVLHETYFLFSSVLSGPGPCEAWEGRPDAVPGCRQAGARRQPATTPVMVASASSVTALSRLILHGTGCRRPTVAGCPAKMEYYSCAPHCLEVPGCPAWLDASERA